jgi:hypothetical protein
MEVQRRPILQQEEKASGNFGREKNGLTCQPVALLESALARRIAKAVGSYIDSQPSDLRGPFMAFPCILWPLHLCKGFHVHLIV